MTKQYPPEVLQRPMRVVTSRLAEQGFSFSGCTALEFFAREGNWHTLSYAEKVRELHAWELDASYEAALRRNLPQAQIRIGDSFRLSELHEFAGKFDLIVYDNPQVVFGENQQYCEHFEALETVRRLIKESGAVIFNVNRQPFDYDAFPEWRKRREAFYGVSETSRLTEPFIRAFYEKFFKERNFEVTNVLLQPRHAEYLMYVAAALKTAN